MLPDPFRDALVCTVCGEPADPAAFVPQDLRWRLEALGDGLCGASGGLWTFRERPEAYPTPAEIAERELAIRREHAAAEGGRWEGDEPPLPLYLRQPPVRPTNHSLTDHSPTHPLTTPETPMAPEPIDSKPRNPIDHLIDALDNASPEQLERIDREIAACQKRIKSLTLLRQTLARNLGLETPAPRRGKLADRIIELLQAGESPATIDALAERLETSRGYVNNCVQKSKRLTLRRDGQVALAK